MKKSVASKIFFCLKGTSILLVIYKFHNFFSKNVTFTAKNIARFGTFLDCMQLQLKDMAH